MGKVTVIKNGIVFDSVLQSFSEKNVYIRNDKVIAKEHIQQEDEVIEWDAKGLYVSPGFIDIHVHVFEHVAKIGINADKVGIKQGVTTIVDAGSSGWEDFTNFKEMIINKSQTEVLVFLNIASKGLVGGLDELSAPDKWMDMERWLEIWQREKAIVGLKARMSQSVVGSQGVLPLEHARLLADEVGVPIMVHIGSPPPMLSEIFPLLKEGDIVTHAFHGKKGGILDETGQLIPVVSNAINRGVKLDVGHGSASFSFHTINQFRQNYNYPFTISTDIYDKNYDKPVGSLIDTVSKLLMFGFRLEAMLTAVTLLPAKNLSLPYHGILDIGKKADITVFDIKNRTVRYEDSQGEEMISTRQLEVYATWKNGKLVHQRG